MTGKPGMMLYFEVIPCLQELDDHQVARLLRAALAYSQKGTAPDFSDDRELQIVWSFIRLRVDQDEERYHKRVERGRHAAQCRWGKERGEGRE